MDPQDTPESNIPATKINPNENQTDQVRNSTKKIEPSHLKKNEFALILIGALLLTVVIFFLFFRSSDIRTETVKTNTSSSSFADLEERVESLEKSLEKALEIWENADLVSDGSGTGGAMGIGPVKERVASLETAFSVKFDSLLKRMNDIEKSISGLKKKSITVTTSEPVAKPVAPVEKEIKAGLFHTIKKGETLYGISKKYNTTVTNIRNLNKFSPDAKIYPGDSILVR